MAKKQRVETVPIEDVNDRIYDLNKAGVTVLSISIDRERGQMWLLTEGDIRG